ncbi:AraC-like DNA-binding protein [Sphingobium fontiphilum]|uniref:AraC-like DNA-binding protein n=1 Tax=Sphingobium fontiphilum TaxID=944425 RepID=A0A7W6DJR3_9SPHN|nr:helix-turn-helix domain-containing protein [Sphingobium fontiphilum]MBB3981945.1 AraC-like DNA-binding protein [Sphingobium fontiphilum]
MDQPGRPGIGDDKGASQNRNFPFSVDGAYGPVRLRYFAPPVKLRAYFGSLYLFEVDLAQYSDVTRADVPQLRFMLSGQGQYRFRDGHDVDTPEICLLGPTLGATRFDLTSPARVLGISLLPAGWITLHGGDASSFADRPCDMGVGPAGEPYRAMLEQARTIDDPEQMAAQAWRFMAARIRPLTDATWTLLHAIDHWLTDEPSPRIEVLADATGLSVRQLTRLTRSLYGAPPKLLARKYRALRCSARIAVDGENWQALCDDGTFYDQSHFIREIKQFIGLTPHQLMTEPSAVAALTMLRRSLGGDVAALNRLS